MGHAPGELANRLHLLGLPQLLLEFLLRRHVPEQAQHHRGLAPQLHKRASVLQRHDIAVAQAQTELPRLLDDPIPEALAEFLLKRDK